jgi:hypothetical protein
MIQSVKDENIFQRWHSRIIENLQCKFNFRIWKSETTKHHSCESSSLQVFPCLDEKENDHDESNRLDHTWESEYRDGCPD